MKVLVLTVGGSCAPLITSIKQNKPKTIHFICSNNSRSQIDGKGKVCDKSNDPDKPNVLVQSEIPEEKKEDLYQIHEIKNIDDFNSCYVDCLNILSDIREKNPEAEIIVDYTGGTKSMAGGLAAASLEFCGIKLCFVGGERNDLIQVQDGTQRIRITQTDIVFLNRQLKQAKKLMDKYDFWGSIAILEEITMVPSIPENINNEIQCLYSFSKAFRAWDRFDHIEAWKLLKQNRKIAHENVMFLESVICSRVKFDDDLRNIKIEGICSPKGCGYELVEDLVLNAERRASQGRYDDAVGRLYRAFEMLVQMRLRDRKYSIDTGNVDLEKLPEILRAEYEARKKENEKIVFGLRNSYELLSRLNPEDELGKLYAENRKRLEDSLTIRNKSLYAHGMSPISKVQYEEFYERFVNGVLDPFLKTFGKKYALRTQFASADKLLGKM